MTSAVEQEFPGSIDELPDDVAVAAGAIADRLRAGQSIDRIVAVGVRTGWWTEQLVDWVADGRRGPPPVAVLERPVVAGSPASSDGPAPAEPSPVDESTSLSVEAGLHDDPPAAAVIAPSTEAFDEGLAAAVAQLPEAWTEAVGVVDEDVAPAWAEKAFELMANRDEITSGYEANADVAAPPPDPAPAVVDDGPSGLEAEAARPHTRPGGPGPAPVATAHDVLATARAHPDPDIRAKAERVVTAVNALCTALSRSTARRR